MNIIQQARNLKGMSRGELAKAIGCTPAMVGHLERGIRNLTPDRAIAIERALGVDRSLLLPELFKRESA